MITYKSTNTLNGKFYIGSTKDFDKRKKGHLASSLNYPFQNALRQNPGAFEWETVEDDSEEPVLEQALLDMWFGTEMCYNLCPYAFRPQCDPEVASQWGKINGPIQGQSRYDSKTGIFDPKFAQDKQRWLSEGGKTTAAIIGQPVRIHYTDGSYRDYPTLKQAGRDSKISHSTIKRLLRQDGKVSRSGFRVEVI